LPVYSSLRGITTRHHESHPTNRFHTAVALRSLASIGGIEVAQNSKKVQLTEAAKNFFSAEKIQMSIPRPDSIIRMTKLHLAVTAAVIMCILGLHKISNLRAGQATDSELASFLAAQIYWIPVNSNSVSRDVTILDTVIRDVLTNRMFASTRQFYGHSLNAPIRPEGFPPGYKPNIPNYRFEPLCATNLGSGLNFTIFLAGIWTEQPIPKNIQDDFRMVRPPLPPERGVLLSLYNSGGPITNGNTLDAGAMGACMIGYEIRPATNGWEIGLLGYIDP
jgi:hypothetical protein